MSNPVDSHRSIHGYRTSPIPILRIAANPGVAASVMIGA
jgi:hypothetical protein